MGTTPFDPNYLVEAPTPAERHYTPAEVAELWQLDVETIRRLFHEEPGVIALQAPPTNGRRAYRTVFWSRVHKGLQR